MKRNRNSRVMLAFAAIVGASLAIGGGPAHASMTVFVGEPFGKFGTMMPLGHTALYLDRVCADGPLRLRMCTRYEAPGVVISRYYSIGRYDWLATPVMEYLYARERASDVPAYATPEMVWQMRERYRQQYLRAVVPDGSEGHFHNDGGAAGANGLEEWWESAGMAYNRRIWAFQVDTLPEQDRRLVEVMNADENRHIYRLQRANCADFVANLLNLSYPGAAHADRIADFGLMTPKEVVRSLSGYASSHPEIGLKVWEIPQVPGTLRRSRPVRGAAESLLKTKRYLFTLLAIQPEVPAGMTILYLWHGRWKIGEGAEPWPGLPERSTQTASAFRRDLQAIAAKQSPPAPFPNRGFAAGSQAQSATKDQSAQSTASP